MHGMICWLAAVVYNAVDDIVENHVLKAIDNYPNDGLLSFTHSEMF